MSHSIHEPGPTLIEIGTDGYATILVGTQGPPGPPGPSGSAANRETFNPTQAQTSFTLALAATVPALSSVFLNGVKTRYAIDYQLDGVTLTWLSALTLTPSDTLEILYS